MTEKKAEFALVTGWSQAMTIFWHQAKNTSGGISRKRLGIRDFF